MEKEQQGINDSRTRQKEMGGDKYRTRRREEGKLTAQMSERVNILANIPIVYVSLHTYIV